MKNIKGFIGLLTFAICLWGVVVVTYASQGKGEIAKWEKLRPLTGSSCSSSSSSSGSE